MVKWKICSCCDLSGFSPKVTPFDLLALDWRLKIVLSEHRNAKEFLRERVEAENAAQAE